MKKVWNYIRAYRQKMNLLYEQNKADIRQESGLITSVTCGLMIFIMFLLWLTSYIFPVFETLQPIYFFAFFSSIAFFCIYLLLHKRIPPTIFLYVLFFLCIGYSAIVSSLYVVDEKSVTVLAILLITPTLILNKSWFVAILELLGIMLYMEVIQLYKSPILVGEELVNVVVFSAIGFVLGHYLKLNKLMNFDLKRQAILEKNTDYLTKLPNRLKLFDDLSKKNFREHTFSVLMMDIDYFKLYNDHYGHQGGDLCLQRLSKCLRQFEKKHPITFYRYGGEEFVALVDGGDREELQRLGDCLNQKIQKLQIPHKESNFGVVTISIGYAVPADLNHVHYELLISKADLALYYAKQQGRNQTVGYRPDMLEGQEFHEMKTHIGTLRRKIKRK